MVDGYQHPFSFLAFETWALSEHGKAKATVYYNAGRLASMERDGLDIRLFLSSPAAGRAEGGRYIAKMKRDERSANALRTHQKVLNWLVAYGNHLQPDDGWKEWDLEPEPPAIPKTVDMENVARLWTEWVAEDWYMTFFDRCLAYVAYHGNFRRGELDRQRKSHILPATAQWALERASKRSLSGLVEMPWTMFFPDSPVVQFLQVRVELPDGADWLWTVPTTYNKLRPRRVRGGFLYDRLVAMGKKMGVSLNFIRTKRRALSDIDEQSTDLRVTSARARHVKIDNTIKYLGRVTSRRQRNELAERGVPGYAPELAAKALRELPNSGLIDAPRRDDRHGFGHALDSGRAVQGMGYVLHARADAPQRDDEQDVREEQERQQGQPGTAQQKVLGSHARRAAPPLFPLSHQSPARDTKADPTMPDGGRRGIVQEAVTGANSHPARLSTPPGLFPSASRSASHDPARRSSAASPVRDLPHPQGVPNRMHEPTIVLKDGDLRHPIAHVEPIALGRIASSPSSGAEWRPGASSSQPTPELPLQLRARRIPRNPNRVAGEGTFTDAEVVAPSGATGHSTHSRHPLSRAASRAEVSSAATRRGC